MRKFKDQLNKPKEYGPLVIYLGKSCFDKVVAFSVLVNVTVNLFVAAMKSRLKFAFKVATAKDSKRRAYMMIAMP
jgi:hypothetical protein